MNKKSRQNPKKSNRLPFFKPKHQTSHAQAYAARRPCQSVRSATARSPYSLASCDCDCALSFFFVIYPLPEAGQKTSIPTITQQHRTASCSSKKPLKVVKLCRTVCCALVRSVGPGRVRPVPMKSLTDRPTDRRAHTAHSTRCSVSVLHQITYRSTQHPASQPARMNGDEVTTLPRFLAYRSSTRPVRPLQPGISQPTNNHTRAWFALMIAPFPSSSLRSFIACADC